MVQQQVHVAGMLPKTKAVLGQLSWIKDYEKSFVTVLVKVLVKVGLKVSMGKSDSFSCQPLSFERL